ncbi:MAG TPA: AsnC family transcriptional regulator [Streptosporangiaceae bacterium]|jgi:DNA-binding Lrp family transcriptional regulator|nr:AsnC family transcriptional regulator [Streptosporangiaceae bacterium]
MSNRPPPESSSRDALDLQIIHALQLRPRASFSRIAAVTGVSEQTVARRYRRLHADGVIRVIGLVDPRRVGQNDWVVRVRVRPGSAARLAEALARRDDVAWVTLGAAGSEVVCSVRSRSQEQRDELLLRRLPGTAPVLGISAHAVLHRFAGSEADWLGYGGPLGAGLLSAGQIERLGQPPDDQPSDDLPRAGGLPTAPGPAGGPAVRLEPGDQPMLDLLAADGRAGYAALATATRWTQSRAARRLELLQRHGIVYFDVDVATRMFGFDTTAYLWLTVEPARLGELGEELASHPEVPFAAAVSGASNLLASVVCRDIEALYQYVSGRIGGLDGVRQIETSPELRRIKQAGSLMDGPRLADPAPVP